VRIENDRQKKEKKENRKSITHTRRQRDPNAAPEAGVWSSGNIVHTSQSARAPPIRLHMQYNINHFF
jgi:hypothetical protein